MAIKNISRREFLKLSTSVGLGFATYPLLSGCTPKVQSTEVATNEPGKPTPVEFIGWTYEPELARLNLDRFESLSNNVKVNFTAIVVAQFADKAVTMFTGKAPIDVIQVRDENLTSWVNAGFLKPIDGMPRLDEYKSDMFPFFLEGATYQDKLWGLPYFTDFRAFGYNEEYLQKGGFSEPPKNLDELKQQAIAIKKAGIMEYPLLIDWKTATWTHRTWWSLVYGAGGKLFDQEMNPLFPDEDPTALSVLEWIVNGFMGDKFIDPVSLEMDNNQTRDAFKAGQGTFVFHNKYDLQSFNDPEQSQIAGKAKMALIPSYGTPVGKGKVNQTISMVRLYCFGNQVQNQDASWELLEYLGGKDPTGEYYTAKMWYKLRGLGYGYKSMSQDPEIIEATSGWGDINLINEQQNLARPNELNAAMWGAEWEAHNYAVLQEAVLGKMTAREALESSAAKARELKKG